MSEGRIAFVGDVHLDRDPAPVREFGAFLGRLGDRCDTVVLMGDLFDLWIGDAACQRPHHRAIVTALTELRGRGVAVHYVEGNRDYRIDRVPGAPFDAVHPDTAIFERAGRSIVAVHGDRANPDDRRYRAWRTLSRSAAFWFLFRRVPRSRRASFAEGMERRMRSTNRDYKRGLPEDVVRDYARARMEDSTVAVVMGHFHVERRFPLEHGDLFVLPEWKESRRHLEWDAVSPPRFVDSGAV